jgi:hypothetical protein
MALLNWPVHVFYEPGIYDWLNWIKLGRPPSFGFCFLIEISFFGVLLYGSEVMPGLFCNTPQGFPLYGSFGV